MAFLARKEPSKFCKLVHSADGSLRDHALQQLRAAAASEPEEISLDFEQEARLTALEEAVAHG